MTEINSMLSKTAEMTSQSYHASEKNTQAVEQGKQAMQVMCQAISEIKKSNQHIYNQVEEGNKKIKDIVHVINEIENKTKIINEIVFQTKLLSFNASVEAARAGEHGKGFAVVAEEVGNLAQMSGGAAKEISTLLEASTTKVEVIVDEISKQVTTLMQKAAEKIEEGEKIGDECMESFERIFLNSNEINSFINEITNSSKEQAKGIQEINQAMHELDVVTQQNSVVAQRSSQSSNDLLKQSKIIEKISGDLLAIMEGKKTKNGGDYNSDQTTSKYAARAPSDTHANPTTSTPSANDPRFEEL